MKAHLLYRDRDLDGDRPPPWNARTLAEDLGLDALLAAMAGGDEFVLDVCRRVLTAAFDTDIATIRHRQDVLRDCLAQPSMARKLYDLSVQVSEEERKQWFLGGADRSPGWVLHRSIELMAIFGRFLERLREFAAAHGGGCTSEGWTALFATVQCEVGDEYLAEVAGHLAQLKFPRGALLSARLDEGNKGTDYRLHRLAPPPGRGWSLARAWASRHLPPPRDVFRFAVHPRDEAGAQALRELRERWTADVARALGRSADHVRSFFHVLRTELAFYVGCLNLHERLAAKGEPLCFPTPVPAADRRLSFRGLYDPCLSLSMPERVVGNDLDADGRRLIIVTGPNQGGKSTWLRSIGVAQVMMQCGLFVPAESFTASTCGALFTHHRREEDTTMEHGKLDEELRRMSDIVDHLTGDSMILFNESFAGTNEREGSEIARQIVSPLLDAGIRVAFVTHQYEFARGFYEQDRGDVLFLRAEREASGRRTFKVREGEPLPTSHGKDLYDAIFGDAGG